MMIKTVALETAYFGVRVNGVATGVTKTAARTKEEDIGMGLTVMENKKFLYDAQQDVPLLGQLNHPEEVANALLFLASPDSSFTTGEILVIDGGQSLTTDKYDDYVRLLQRNASTLQ
jgi:3-oxoacyl-[acyl-carrier protein] reductase